MGEEAFQMENCPTEISQFMNEIKSELQGFTQKVIETELGLFETSMAISSLDVKKLKRAHEDTENFRRKTFSQAVGIAKNSGNTPLQEYKKLLNFI